jgi:hypothetical protein
LNSALAKECIWQNNHAILQGQILFYNKKNIQIKKTEGTAKKTIRFYYVLSSGKPAPTVPSDQGFYQSLWDGLERSKRSLKQTAPSARAALPPPKKAKASSSASILPDPVNNSPLSSLPPELFQEANQMAQEAWMVAFPSLRFPSKWIGVALHLQAVKIGIQDEQLGNGTAFIDVPNRYEIVVDSDLARFRRERGLVTALKYVLDQKSNQPSQHTKHLLAAFAASHPQILVIYPELLIALARYTFLLEVKAYVEYSGKAKGIDMSFINLKNVANCSLCCTFLTNWVTKLARDQYLIFSSKMARIDETKPPNYWQRKQGEDLPPSLLGYFPYKPMGLKANMIGLEQELKAREISFNRKLTVTRKVKILKEDTPGRLERQVEVKLRTRGYKWTGLKLPAKIQLLKQDMEAKEEQAGGEYDIDILKYFKLVSFSIDQSIFED